MIVDIHILRTDSSSQMDFTLDIDSQESVLDALEHIRNTLDPSLNYRHSCHHGSCGTCACLINGTQALACMTTISSLGTDRVSVEPLPGFPLVSDLVVDLSTMISAMPIDTYLKESGLPHETDLDHPWLRFERCIECGCCHSACPVEGSFLGPAVLSSMHRTLLKSSDDAQLLHIREQVYGPEGVDACASHFACSRVCPVKVSPGKHITEMKKER